MSRELERRLTLLERAVSPDGIKYTVSDRPPEDGEAGHTPVVPITEAEWLKIYGEVETDQLEVVGHSCLGARERCD